MDSPSIEYLGGKESTRAGRLCSSMKGKLPIQKFIGPMDWHDTGKVDHPR